MHRTLPMLALGLCTLAASAFALAQGLPLFGTAIFGDAVFGGVTGTPRAVPALGGFGVIFSIAMLAAAGRRFLAQRALK